LTLESPRARIGTRIMPKILIVDDSPLDLAILEEYLRPLQCTLVRATEGYEAIVASERESPDLVLLDILIPGPDGIRVLREIKASAGEEYVPVVLISAISNVDYRHAGLEAGADAFLQKPIDPLDLLPLVRNLLAQRERLQAALRAREGLLRAQESRQVLTNLLVHDLRNPLTVIHSNLEFLLGELAQTGDPEWREAVAESRAASQRLLRMIANLVDTARLEERQQPLELADLGVRALLEGAVQRAQPLDGGRAVEFTAVDEGLRLRADRTLLERCLDNVLDTALRFAPARGRIRLRAGLQAGQVRIEFVASEAVLPKELRAHLFQRFHRIGLNVSPSARHAALALYFCRLVTSAHHGQIGVSLSTGGTTFSLVLPTDSPNPRPS
jgi:K+-sensing histidine kinase KdpD